MDADGLEVDCTAAPEFPTEAEQCEFTPQADTGGDCSDIKDITALTLVWDGPDGVNLTSEVGQVINGINNGDVIILDTPKDQTGNDVDVFLSGTVNAQSQFHISCSDSEMNGPEDCGMNQGNGKSNNSSFNNQFLLGGMTGEKGSFSCPGIPGGGGSAEVVYGFSVENLSTEPVEVIITGADLGITNADLGLPTPAPIAVGGTLDVVTDPFIITPDSSDVFKNTVVVTGVTASGAMCEAMDMVEVKREPPPPPPVSCSDIKDVTAVSVIWNGLGTTVDVSTEAGQLFENVAPGNRITFEEGGAGNDIDMDIFDAVTGALIGESRFHVSCSDDAMNGSEDCGTNQGNGKGNDSNLINDWLFDGMTGEKGFFECGLPNIGEVPPTP